MRITRIDFEGRAPGSGHYATISRRQGSHWIEVTILTPYQPDGKTHRIKADADDNELFNHARNLHLAIEGRQGTNSDIHDYYRELQRFAD